MSDATISAVTDYKQLIYFLKRATELQKTIKLLSCDEKGKDQLFTSGTVLFLAKCVSNFLGDDFFCDADYSDLLFTSHYFNTIPEQEMEAAKKSLIDFLQKLHELEMRATRWEYDNLESFDMDELIKQATADIAPTRIDYRFNKTFSVEVTLPDLNKTGSASKVIVERITVEHVLLHREKIRPVPYDDFAWMPPKSFNEALVRLLRDRDIVPCEYVKSYNCIDIEKFIKDNMTIKEPTYDGHNWFDVIAWADSYLKEMYDRVEMCKSVESFEVD